MKISVIPIKSAVFLVKTTGTEFAILQKIIIKTPTPSWKN
jgi:hypothetical protein